MVHKIASPLLFVTYQFKTGGVEKVLINLANYLKAKIYLITIIQEYDDIIQLLPDNVCLLDFKGPIKKSNIIIQLFLIIRKVIFIKTNASLKNVRIINFSDTFYSLLVSYLSSPKNFYSWIHCNPDGLYNYRSFFLYTMLLKKCKKIICLCDQQKDMLQKILYNNIQTNKLAICYNLVDKEEIQKKMKDEIAIDFEYFVMVARIDLRSKDFFTLINAYSLLADTIKNNYKLVFIGDGPDREIINDYIIEKKMDKYVYLMGNKINPYSWMSRAALFIHSSKSEGYAIVLEEAMVCGVSVISADCPVGPKEILDNGKYGLLFDVGDENMLKEKIEFLIKNKENTKYYMRQSIIRSEMLIQIAERQITEILANDGKQSI